HLIFLKPRFDVYRAVSKQIQAIFHEFTDLVEPLSLDEAYLDVTSNKMNNPSATLLATDIRKRILRETNLTASAGVSFNKFLAKVASDLNKPNGQAVIEPKDAERFLEALPIRKFFGIGAATAEKMKILGIEKGADLKKYSEVELIKLFGKSGAWYFKIVRGEDRREVKTDRIRKSVGAERTFLEDLCTDAEMIEKLDEIIDIEIGRLKSVRTSGTTVTLKIKYNNFVTRTRSKTLRHPVRNRSELRAVIMELLHTPTLPERPVRLLGVTLSNLTLEHEDDGQMMLELE
ncbi:DNA polymerase IV, partial [bacterium]|nr:DNA polymerase IV [bacterium]